MTEESVSVREVEEPSTQPGRSDLLVSLLASTRALTIIALAVIIAFGGALRFYNLNWDSPAMVDPAAADSPSHLHPDERFMAMVEDSIEVPGSLGLYFDTDSSPLNPYQQERDYVYGTLPLFLVKIIGNITGNTGYDEITETGRAVTALFDTMTILLVFLIGRRLAGRNVGLLASLLYAAAVLPIQHAHFFVVDSYVTFFAAAAVYFSIGVAQNGRWHNYALAGLMTGLAMACKLTAVSLVPVVGLAAAIHAWPSYKHLLPFRRESDEGRPEGEGESALKRPRLRGDVIGLALMLLLAFGAFRIAQPYAFTTPSWSDFAIWDRDERIVNLPNACTEKRVGGETVRSCNLLVTEVASRLNFNPRFVQDQLNQRNLLGGDAMFPPSVQWIGRTKWLYPLEQMVLWGMGPALGITAWAGFLYAAWRAVFRCEALALVLLAWVAGYFVFMGGQFSLYMRYFLPIYPVLAVFASMLLIHLWRSVRSPPFLAGVRALAPRSVPAARWLGVGAVVVVSAATVLWALSYASIYSRPHTRLEASKWIFENVPEGSVVTNESWDDALPMSLPSGNARAYQQISMNGYGVDSERGKMAELIDFLDQADYIVLSSARLSGTIPRAPAIYPVTSRYYDLLLDEKLGFRLAAKFTSYPGLLGVAIPDDAAEESFSVYDHPKVLIFEKTEQYSTESAVMLLNPAEGANAVSMTPAEAGGNALLMTPDEAAKQQEGGTWTSIFDPESFSNRFPAVTWLLAIEIVSLALAPLALLVFRSLPDRGYLLTKPLGLLAVSWLVWLGASLKLFDFTRGSIAVVFLLIVAVGAATARLQKGAWRDYVKRHWRAILLSEALFLGAFLAFYWIRTLNPDLWHSSRGGEKPMELAYLNAVTRSTTMPPYDPWLAGGYLNYYYFGQFMTATLIKFSGILPEIAFNLAVPTFFAMTVGAAYSVCLNLAEAVRRRVRLPRGPFGGAKGPVMAGLAAVVLVAVVGNLQALYQTVERFSAVSDWRLGSGIPLISGMVGLIGGVWNVIIGNAGRLPGFDFWAPSRIMPGQASITEFPFWTFLFADLHAHLMAIPFDITILGVALALVLRPKASMKKSDGGGRATGWAGIAVLALLVGALRPINSWDYPPFLLLAVAAVFISERAAEGRANWRMVGVATGKAAVLVVLSVLFFFPFWRDYHLFYKGFHASTETTQLDWYLDHFGLFLFATGSLLAFFTWRAFRRRPERTAPLYVLTFAAVGLVVSLGVAFSGESHRLPITVTGLSVSSFLGDLASNDLPVVLLSMAVIALLLLLAWRELRSWRADSPVRLFLFAMVGMALALSAAVDVLTLDGDIDRMNTVFKFYVHVWLLFAVVSAFGLWYLLAVTARRRPPKKSGATGQLAGWAKGGWTAVLAVLLGASLIYPFSGTRARVSAGERFDEYTGRGVNGMEYMKHAVYRDEFGPVELKYDYDAIQWMRQNVEGTPVIVEAQTPNYRWGSRFSIYTGLPTVIGWGWHQQQQRGKYADMVIEREEQVKQFYSTPSVDEAIIFLQRYNVSYVIVGQIERGYYGPEGMSKFEEMDGQELRLVFKNEGTRIYEVAALPPILPSS